MFFCLFPSFPTCVLSLCCQDLSCECSPVRVHAALGQLRSLSSGFSTSLDDTLLFPLAGQLLLAWGAVTAYLGILLHPGSLSCSRSGLLQPKRATSALKAAELIEKSHYLFFYFPQTWMQVT